MTRMGADFPGGGRDSKQRDRQGPFGGKLEEFRAADETTGTIIQIGPQRDAGRQVQPGLLARAAREARLDTDLERAPAGDRPDRSTDDAVVPQQQIELRLRWSPGDRSPGMMLRRVEPALGSVLDHHVLQTAVRVEDL